VIGTTRFPRDAAARFAAEPDFADWARRVHLHGLDFRAPAWVEAFADHLASSFGRLHILVNNAAQTIRRPAPFHAHLVPAERAPAREVARPLRPLLASGRQLAERLRGEEAMPREGLAALFSQARVLPEDAPTLAAGGVEEVGAGFDRRARNSWVLGLGEVASAEALEALLVNAAAPFILTGRLREMMAREALSDKWVVHVTAVEGQFSRRHKDGRHPHLDMAKAALNMLTRTSSDDYARDRIFMNSVDVGWFSNGEPEAVAAAMSERGFTLPLDEVDAAARVCDPIFSGVRTGASRHGQLLKNYAPHPW
jgi:NAD(P)-dependent dehydrogenase (short-subunit alcohol dehydrogenase family)